jgi:hypothetical protein
LRYSALIRLITRVTSLVMVGESLFNRLHHTASSAQTIRV